ncbi:hypothetical protein K439DRAFT_1349355 [Ramaria rubella]|nr:hypothetical protein K439DRAFT_1349355 [Ramaria rubella]
MLTQLRTGHVPLNHHLHRIGAWETPFCAHCKTKREMVFHFIMDCDAYKDQRTQLRDTIPQELYTIGNLLSNKACVTELVKYVEGTGRLHQVFWNKRG